MLQNGISSSLLTGVARELLFARVVASGLAAAAAKGVWLALGFRRTSELVQSEAAEEAEAVLGWSEGVTDEVGVGWLRFYMLRETKDLSDW